ncbi:acetoacetate decarboxylase family protein [Sulfolobus sp. S-194]|uniref:acetoacetate decarboxylase family protein n=1 Tax=Sulfolobus sp. S-194 TaxID=2512240 RepID=UPI0025700CF4|nr:acetoacetate decarboxylase family protein [Sulfolobus sp. S-194]
MQTRNVFNIFTLPITKSGQSQIVPPPPWIYAIEMIGVKAFFDLNRITDLIPPPLEPTDGEGFVYIAKIFTISDNRWEMLYEDPEETKYMEAAIALKVKYKDSIYTYFPFMWVDKDLPLIRGWLLGYPKKLAIIAMSEYHKLLDNYNGPAEGIKMGGYAVRNGREIIRMRITLKEKYSSPPIPFGPIVQFRRFPSVQEGTNVYELGQVISSDFRAGDIWRGDGELLLNNSINDELELFKINKIEAGYYFNWSFKQLGTKILAKL